MAYPGNCEKDKKSAGTKHVAASWSVFLVLTIIGTAIIVTGLVGSQLVQFGSSCRRDGNDVAGAVDNIRDIANTVNDTHYNGLNEHPACRFLRINDPKNGNEHSWGPYSLCMEQTNEWYTRSRSNCYSCLYPDVNVCRNPPTVYYHQYLESLHPERWEGNLLAMKAFLMTQDLSHSRMMVWVPQPSKIYTDKTAAFFDEFSDYITLQPFDYDKEVKGTTWESDPFFGNGTLVKQMMPAPGSYSDVVRIMLLHKYGGLWLDNDVIFYNDVTHLLAQSYQFVMRWMNLHIMYMAANSSLTWRAMELAKTMPLNHPKFKEDIIEKRCKPYGYYQLVADRYGNTDIYNGCLHRLLLRFNNTGLPPEGTLYDLPLGWWDHDWIGCFKQREAINNTRWNQVASTYLAMHNRYPGDGNLGPETSPLRRVIKIINDFFAKCDNVNCLPLDGMPLIAYDGLNEVPSSKTRRLLAVLNRARHRHVHSGAAGQPQNWQRFIGVDANAWHQQLASLALAPKHA